MNKIETHPQSEDLQPGDGERDPVALVKKRLEGLSYDEQYNIQFSPEEAVDYAIACANERKVEPTRSEIVREISRDKLVEWARNEFAEEQELAKAKKQTSTPGLGGWLRNVEPGRARMGGSPYHEEALVKYAGKLFWVRWDK